MTREVGGCQQGSQHRSAFQNSWGSLSGALRGDRDNVPSRTARKPSTMSFLEQLGELVRKHSSEHPGEPVTKCTAEQQTAAGRAGDMAASSRDTKNVPIKETGLISLSVAPTKSTSQIMHSFWSGRRRFVATQVARFSTLTCADCI